MPTAEKLTGGAAIVEALVANGVDTVFGLPGAQQPMAVQSAAVVLSMPGADVSVLRRAAAAGGRDPHHRRAA
jgi:hypothetical protein